MKANRTVWITLILSAALLTAGCVSPSKKLTFLPIQAEALPADARIAGAGVGYLIHGSAPPQGLGFRMRPGVNETLKKGAFPYKGFYRTGQRLFRYEEVPQDPQLRALGGVLSMEDAFGRSAQVKYEMTYHRSDSGIEVASLSLEPFFATDQETEFFLVPAERIPEDLSAIEPTWENLYLLSRRLNSQAKESVGDGRAEKAYVLMAFFRNQAAPSAHFKAMVANKQTTDYGWGWCSSGVSYVDFDGWRVAMISGRFPAMPQRGFYVKAYFKPGRETDDNTMKLLFNEPLGDITRRAYSLN